MVHGLWTERLALRADGPRPLVEESFDLAGRDLVAARLEEKRIEEVPPERALRLRVRGPAPCLVGLRRPFLRDPMNLAIRTLTGRPRRTERSGTSR